MIGIYDAYFLRAKMVRDADGFGFMVHGSWFVRLTNGFKYQVWSETISV